MRTLTALLLSIASLQAFAAHDAPVLRDPWVPPQVAKKAAVQPAAMPSKGAALQAQVERKLRESFEAADVERRGSITLEQARAAGLGRVARDFARIDVRGTGRVTFDDYRRYLVGEGASPALLPPTGTTLR